MTRSLSIHKMIVLDNGEFGKPCNTCYQIKPLIDFSPDERRSDGYFGSCKECLAARQKIIRTKDKVRKYNLKQLYGISIEEYQRLYDLQEGKCKICKVQFDKLVIDHCHKTKKIRGLLCGNCNIGIGNLQHDLQILENAINYLKELEKSNE